MAKNFRAPPNNLILREMTGDEPPLEAESGINALAKCLNRLYVRMLLPFPNLSNMRILSDILSGLDIADGMMQSMGGPLCSMLFYFKKAEASGIFVAFSWKLSAQDMSP